MNFMTSLGIISAVLGIFFVVFCIIFGVGFILTIIGKWKVFKKCGKQGWEAIIPFYSDYILCEIAGLEWWFFLIINAVVICNVLLLSILSPLAGLAALGAKFCANYNLAKKFSKDPVGYGIGLTILPFIFYPILGFGMNDFNDVKVSSYGPFTDTREGSFETANNSDNKEEPKTKKSIKKCPNCKFTIDKEDKFCPNCGTKID